MNSGVPQYKNCWKWKHIIFSCRIQGDKYIKYNGLHKSKHHRYFTWCCKANPKTNSSRLETKQDKLCLHSFKCSNYQGDYQADSNYYLFWKHRFNHKWHAKKYQELCENRRQSIHSAVDDIQA